MSILTPVLKIVFLSYFYFPRDKPRSFSLLGHKSAYGYTLYTQSHLSGFLLRLVYGYMSQFRRILLCLRYRYMSQFGGVSAVSEIQVLSYYCLSPYQCMSILPPFPVRFESITLSIILLQNGSDSGPLFSQVDS